MFSPAEIAPPQNLHPRRKRRGPPQILRTNHQEPSLMIKLKLHHLSARLRGAMRAVMNGPSAKRNWPLPKPHGCSPCGPTRRCGLIS